MLGIVDARLLNVKCLISLQPLVELFGDVLLEPLILYLIVLCTGLIDTRLQILLSVNL